jgi:hypothetical protein
MAQGRVRALLWGMLVCMLLSTLVPTVSRALAARRPLAERGWVEVCSHQGRAWVQVDTGASPPTLQTVAQPASEVGGLPASLAWLHLLDACDFCTLANDRGTPPPSFDGWGLSSALPWACPMLRSVGLISAVVHAAWARGPPAGI